MKKKIAYFNCTGVLSHIGCLAVTDAHLRMLIKNGYEIPYIYTVLDTRHLWKGDIESSLKAIDSENIAKDINNADAIVVNGEGTIHHNKGLDLLAILKYAKDHRKPSYLTNALLQEMDDSWNDLFKSLDDINVRELKSHEYMNSKDISNRLVLDSILEAKFDDKITHDYQNKIIVTDWHSARSHDIGEASSKFIEGRGERETEFLPYDHWMYIQDQSWRNQIANTQTAKLTVTARHHGMYIAMMSGTPFVVMPSNSHKIEGMVRYSKIPIPFARNYEQLEEKAKYAIENPSIFKDLKDFIYEHKPLSTFDKLYEDVPTNIEQLTDDEVDKEVQKITEKLYQRSFEREMRASLKYNQKKVESGKAIEQLKQRNATLKETLDNVKANYKDRTEKSTARMNSLKEANENLRGSITKLKENNQKSAETIKNLKEENVTKINNYNDEIKNLKNEIKELKTEIAKQNSELRVIPKLENNVNKYKSSLLRAYSNLARLYLNNKEYSSAYETANNGLEIDKYSPQLITALFKSEVEIDIEEKIEKNYCNNYIQQLEDENYSIEKTEALAKAYSFGPNYDKALANYKILEQEREIKPSEQLEIAQFEHALGNFEEAEKTYSHILETNPEYEMTTARLLKTLYYQTGKRDLGKELIGNLDNEELIHKKQLQGLYDFMNDFMKTDFDKFTKDLNSLFGRLGTAMVLSQGGIGDEIRHAALYQNLLNISKRKLNKLIITCDPRVKSLMENSFPEIEFISVRRSFYKNNDEEKGKVPPMLKGYFNNEAFERALECDHVIFNHSLMTLFRKDDRDFIDNKHIPLIADENLKQKWREYFSKVKKSEQIKLIGINRGSHLNTAVRHANKFDFNDWEEVFKIPNVQFVNLSFDVSKQEIKELNNQFGTSIIYPKNIDLKNDFDNLAALVSELDFVITPTNYMMDLAGCLGVKTLGLYTTDNYDWRFIGENKKDLWHTSVYGIKSDVCGNKDGIVENVKAFLERELNYMY